MGFVYLLKKETVIPIILWFPVYSEIIFLKTPYLFLDIHYKPNKLEIYEMRLHITLTTVSDDQIETI